VGLGLQHVDHATTAASGRRSCHLAENAGTITI
jgi:hypothetical protein